MVSTRKLSSKLDARTSALASARWVRAFRSGAEDGADAALGLRRGIGRDWAVDLSARVFPAAEAALGLLWYR